MFHVSLRTAAVCGLAVTVAVTTSSLVEAQQPAQPPMKMPMPSSAPPRPQAKKKPVKEPAAQDKEPSARPAASKAKKSLPLPSPEPVTMPGGSIPHLSMSGQPGMAPMMVGPAGVSMDRMGSGTTWIPEAVKLPSRERMLGKWMLMTHGFVFVEYDKQSGERSDSQFGSLNWAMLMATRDFGGGRFQGRTMLSVDPFTVSNRGYPLLLQTGEVYNGEPLHDRQHPHDFWMELGALYQRPITRSLAWSLYAAPAGEPALGPVAFMHRPSAMDNPAAPLGHHWQDATHVSFGVLTAGIFTHTWQLEGSFFNGREPDESRWNFDPIRLDSYSGRITVNPGAQWSLAAGYGFLKSPEALHPAESMHRITASVLHGASIGPEGQVASALVWGANKHAGQSFTHSLALESEGVLDRSTTVFGRAEFIQKSAEDLVVDQPVTIGSGVVLPAFPADRRFNIGAAQLGYIRELFRTHWATIGLGGSATLNFVPSDLKPFYGSRTPIGTFVFLRLRPYHKPGRVMEDMGGMEMEHKHE